MDGNDACLACHDPAGGRRHGAHPPRAGFGRQQLLQLPHAVHVVRPAQGDPQPHHQQPLGRGKRGDRPAECVQPLPRGTRRWPGPERVREWYDLPAPPLGDERTDGGRRAAVGHARGRGPAGAGGLRARLGAGPGSFRHELDDAVPRGAAQRPVRGGALHRLPLAAHGPGYAGLQYDYVADRQARVPPRCPCCGPGSRARCRGPRATPRYWSMRTGSS